MSFDDLNEEIKEFCDERDWQQFHTPKDLSIGLSTEANELLGHFRFKSREDQSELLARRLSCNSTRLIRIKTPPMKAPRGRFHIVGCPVWVNGITALHPLN
jgi:hypothetical protein